MKWFLRTRSIRGWGVSIRLPIRTRPGEGRWEKPDILKRKERERGKKEDGRREKGVVNGLVIIWCGAAVRRVGRDKMIRRIGATNEMWRDGKGSDRRYPGRVNRIPCLRGGWIYKEPWVNDG